MLRIAEVSTVAMLLTGGFLCSVCGPALSAVNIQGQVQVGGSPLASSTVTPWAATTGEPRQLAQIKSGSDGSFVIEQW
jgi:hypothetical protein